MGFKLFPDSDQEFNQDDHWKSTEVEKHNYDPDTQKEQRISSVKGTSTISLGDLNQDGYRMDTEGGVFNVGQSNVGEKIPTIGKHGPVIDKSTDEGSMSSAEKMKQDVSNAEKERAERHKFAVQNRQKKKKSKNNRY